MIMHKLKHILQTYLKLKTGKVGCFICEVILYLSKCGVYF
jgi:hypothetical protein